MSFQKKTSLWKRNLPQLIIDESIVNLNRPWNLHGQIHYQGGIPHIETASQAIDYDHRRSDIVCTQAPGAPRHSSDRKDNIYYGEVEQHISNAQGNYQDYSRQNPFTPCGQIFNHQLHTMVMAQRPGIHTITRSPIKLKKIYSGRFERFQMKGSKMRACLIAEKRGLLFGDSKSDANAIPTYSA